MNLDSKIDAANKFIAHWYVYEGADFMIPPYLQFLVNTWESPIEGANPFRVRSP